MATPNNCCFEARVGQEAGAFDSGWYNSAANNQASVFNTEDKGRTTEYTEKTSFGASRDVWPHSRAKRQNPCFSVSRSSSLFSSVLKTLTCFLAGWIAGPPRNQAAR